MNLNVDVRELPWKKIIVVILLLEVVGVAIAGGWLYSKKHSAHSVDPAQSKDAIANYLHEKTGRSDFKTSFDVSKEKNPWEMLKVSYDAPPDYKTVYRSMGEHLYIAEQMIASSEAREQMMGVVIVLGLTDIALDVACDPWLAARICDAYVIPNIDSVEQSPKNWVTSDRLMRVAARCYREAEEDERLIDVGKMYLSKYGSTPRAVEVRRRLVNLLQSKGRQKEAQTVQELGKNAPLPITLAVKSTNQVARTNNVQRRSLDGTNKVNRLHGGTNQVARTNATARRPRPSTNIVSSTITNAPATNAPQKQLPAQP